MKTDKYQKRFYRKHIDKKGFYASQIAVRQTDLYILTDKPLDKAYVIERIRFYRGQIERYIAKDQRFFTSLKPIPVELTAPAIVRSMAKAASIANVGPMAAVAGAIAQFLGKDLLRKGYQDVIIENGGDIFLKVSRIVNVGVYAGKKNRFSGKLSLVILPRQTPCGICASSGTLGHSLSFGKADSAVVLARNAIVADAVATAAGNMINSPDDLTSAVAFSRACKGVWGVLFVAKDSLATWGKATLK